MTIPCPACGYLTFEESYGSYDICDVCGWEDDAVQLANPCSSGGANAQSLFECQKVFKDSEKTENHSFMVSEDWRPLTQEEIIYYQEISKTSRWAFSGETSASKVYWKKK
jgi:hypothetical protein